MTTSLEYIANIAPEIDANNSTDKKNKFIAIAQAEIDPLLFSDGETYNLAVAYYCCHFLELSSRDGNSRGGLTMEKEGDLSRGYGGISSSSSGSTTQYLDSYNRLLKARVPNFYITYGR